MKTYNFSIDNQNINNIINFSKFKIYENILVQIFCGDSKLQYYTNEILKNLPNAKCIGATTDGEIIENKVTTNNTIISISIFEDTSIKTNYSTIKDSFKNGQDLARKLISEDTKLLITFTDGTITNAEEFLKGIESINNKVIICGGMAGDNSEFIQTYISCNEKIFKRGSVAVALNSKILKVYNDYRFNWSTIGVGHTIDKVKDNRVYSISGMKPTDFYAKYLGHEVAKELPSTGIEFPLIIENGSLKTARAVLKKHEDKSLSFSGNFKEGDIVKLGFGNAEMIMQNPINELKNLLEEFKPESFFLYSCMARRRFMPNFINVEIEPFSNITSTSGFFTYAEFFHNKGHNELLNQTLTIIALSENINNEKIKIKETDNKSDTKYARTIKALAHLIEQSSQDYDVQTKKLHKQKAYSNRLLASQRQFLRHAIHETNTPLSVIMGNIELYEMINGKNEYISNIEVAMKNISSIYDDLSFLIKKDQLVYNKIQIDLVDYIRSRIDFFSQVALQVKSNFILNTNQETMPIFFSESKLQRIIDNNLTNAIKYTYENENIYIDLKNEDNNYILSISSHSCVIQDPKKIFEEYYREEKTKKGLGLGLNLVKKVCQEENIQIDVISDKNNTCFTYTFKGEASENLIIRR
ncbi:FIST N-terminal domain-containing protein [Malaciobacter marinus]|uniref:histidine kinase n=1 Tax=Malaciobacter marinus TaxID=505249 RepID=A0A347TNJ2_9BACT|nr:FIST N-terminal domain-containing protein [Malaciobacter marinus]AXX88170.1 FIST sensor-containing two-component system histidine kinase [Malaciobacter marinus]PHO13877.1 diguanylate cyclase [Malaciobacter marinus]PHO15100.1 diguanylate cyclase [Malaciobacter marinus]